MRLALGFALISALLQGITPAQDPGRRIQLEGQDWFLDCQGDDHPTVVFESGVGSSAETWSEVREGVGEFARACTYRRPEARIGFDRRAAELRKLLETAGEKGPFLLVGHSHGGYVARLLAASWPDGTAGLVLVDPTPESLALEAEGLMPEDHRQMWIQSEAEVRDRLLESRLPDRPLIVLSSEQTGIPAAMAEGYRLDRLLEIGLRLREALAASVPRGEHRFLKGTGHFIHRERPRAVVEAIRQVREQARH